MAVIVYRQKLENLTRLSVRKFLETTDWHLEVVSDWVGKRLRELTHCYPKSTLEYFLTLYYSTLLCCSTLLLSLLYSRYVYLFQRSTYLVCRILTSRDNIQVSVSCWVFLSAEQTICALWSRRQIRRLSYVRLFWSRIAQC